MSRRGLLAAVVVGLFVAAGLWNAAAAGRPVPPDAEVRAVAATLRCPTCVGESAADSTAPLAAGMRDVIADQLAAGRTPAEIREWFAVRYGQDVLLDPPRRGAGWLLWLVPLAAVPIATWLVLRRGRTRGAWAGVTAATVVVVGLAGVTVVDRRSPPTGHAGEVSVGTEPVPVLEAAADRAPGDVEIRAALARALDSAGRVADAVEHYAAVTRLAPADDRAHYLLAFALVRSDRPAEAAPILEDLLRRSPDHPEGLLLLGTLRQDSGAGGEDLLRWFVEVAPDHPAADRVTADLERSDRADAS